MLSATESRDAVSFRRAGARPLVLRWRSLAEILRPNVVLHTIHASQNVQCQNRKHQAQSGFRHDGSHHNEPTASWRSPRTAPRLSDCAELHSVGLRRRALKSGFVNLWVGASRQLGEKGDLHGQCVFRHQPANVMTGVIAAGHRNSFAPDCIRHWQAAKRHP
jgi:hypothetical protein